MELKELIFFSKLSRVRILEESLQEVQKDFDRVYAFLSFKDFKAIYSADDIYFVKNIPTERIGLRQDEVEESSADFLQRLRKTCSIESHGYVSL